LVKHFAHIIKIQFREARRLQAVLPFRISPLAVFSTVPRGRVGASSLALPVRIRTTSFGAFRPVTPWCKLAVHLKKEKVRTKMSQRL